MGLPIVDEEGKLLDIYAKFDVINLAAEKTYNNLDVTLKEANEHRNEWFEGVHTCKRDDSLFAVMETIVKAEVHRLVIINKEEKVCGVVSQSDILSFLVLRPSGEDKRTKSRPSGPSQNEETTKNEDANSDSHAFDEQVKANDDDKDENLDDEQLNN